MVFAESVNNFNNRLDKFWSDQEELFYSIMFIISSIFKFFSDTEAIEACFRYLHVMWCVSHMLVMPTFHLLNVQPHISVV